MNKYYDGTKLLSLSDIDGNKPEIYIVTTNRTGGKTTYFNRLLVNRFIDKGEKFCLVYRYANELTDCAETFFKDIKTLFFNDYEMTSKKAGEGNYYNLYLNDKPCGYAVAINTADKLKRYSHLFNDVQRMIFDEFMPESNRYCSNELKKFMSLHTSIARGQGEQVRYVPVYMISNPVTMINPYYIGMHISERLDNKTKFLKGKGFVLEQGYVESADLAQQQSGFMKAFDDTEYKAYSSQGIYLNDTLAFIEKPEGKSRYICTLKYCGKTYGIREYGDLGFMYCDNKADITHPHKISITSNDHEINYVMLRRNSEFLNILRYMFEKGCFRFRNLECKEAIIQSLTLF